MFATSCDCEFWTTHRHRIEIFETLSVAKGESDNKQISNITHKGASYIANAPTNNNVQARSDYPNAKQVWIGMNLHHLMTSSAFGILFLKCPNGQTTVLCSEVPRSRHETGLQNRLFGRGQLLLSHWNPGGSMAYQWHTIKLQCRLTLFDICKFSSLEKFMICRDILCLTDGLLEKDFLPDFMTLHSFFYQVLRKNHLLGELQDHDLSEMGKSLLMSSAFRLPIMSP